MKNVFKNIKYEKYYKDILPYIKKEKNQQYFTVIFTLGASIFFALFAINPTLSTIAKLKKEVSDSRFVDERLSQKINSLSSLSQAYQDIQPDIPYILDAIPQAPEAPTLIAQIQSVAQDSSVKITNVQVSPIGLTSTTATKSSMFSFELTAKASYDSLQKFTNGIISMQRVISVDSISINKSADETQLLDIDIKGSAYFKP